MSRSKNGILGLDAVVTVGLNDYEIEELAEQITLAMDDVTHCSQISEVIAKTLIGYLDTKKLHKR